tara:strand:- start:30 stop:530 length:501 start_codon:yes stop_codon:yes gene_type:complete
MKKLYILLITTAFLSCETSNTEVQVKGGEIALGNNKGSKFYIAPDENVEIVKKLISSYNNMDLDGIYEVCNDSVMWFAPKLDKPVVADRLFMEAYFSEYDSVNQVVQGYIPHQYEGQKAVVVSVASREKRYKKDGTVEDERLFERFFIIDKKITRVMAWSADWNTN